MSRRDPMVAVQQMRDHGRESMELSGSRSRVDLDLDRTFELALTRLMEIWERRPGEYPESFALATPTFLGRTLPTCATC